MNYQWWDGYRDPRFGYGSMSHGFISHLPKTVTLDDRASVYVHIGVPFSVKRWRVGQHRVLFTMWETTVLPPEFVRWMSQYDQVLVPCQHNVELFRQHHQDVSMVPLGVDQKVWSPREGRRDGPFRFHAGGSLWRRKGLDLVVEAFNALGLPDAELHIKAAPHAQDVPKTRLGENIFLHRDWMSLNQQVDWFHMADCFVAPARGEGWGLMPLQAASAGIPTILSESSGQVEFLDMASHVVPTVQAPSETYGLWDEPVLEVLVEAMRDTYLNRDTRRVEAGVRAKQATKYSWTKAVKSLLATVPGGTLLDGDDWVRPNVTVPIRVNRKVNADIGNHNYRLFPGETYIVPENVHQVLSDAGALEVS